MTERVIEGVLRLGLGVSNAYLVAAEPGWVLIDTGVPGRAAEILVAAAEAGPVAGRPGSIRTIVATHYHADHVGSLARVAAATGARVLAPTLDADLIEAGGIPPSPRGNSRLGRLVMSLSRPAALEPQPIDRRLVDGDELAEAAGLSVIHTPGHTAGHVSLYRPTAGGILFAGDALANVLGLRLGIVNEDWAAARTSARRLAALDFETVVFGHGRPLRGSAGARVRRFVERLAR
jgi:glyoxylase-like metal-dependent hydrolase (beta-lactamase superfamily II)